MTELDILEIAAADRAASEDRRNFNLRTEIALAAIMDALGLTGLSGWNDWSRAAADGVWS